MMKSSNSWITLGAVLAGLAVVTGAFAAHGLDSYFLKIYAGETRKIAGEVVPAASKYLGDFKTGAEYQMYHALALIAVGLLGRMKPGRLLTITGWLFMLGIVLFSGSLYVLTLTDQPAWGAVTPIGGILMIVGWLTLAVAACPCGETHSTSHSSE